MYTLLTSLGMVAAYALLRATEEREAPPWDEGRMTKDRSQRSSFGIRPSSVTWWLVFVLASAAMLYTHYFGVFLLGAFGLCALGAWVAGTLRREPLRREPRWRQLGAFFLSALAIFILYLPWLPAMLNRYGVDRSYWQGALKLNEALRHVAISFTVGAPETMLEADAVQLLPWFGLALAVAVVTLVWRGGRSSGGAPSEEWRGRGAEGRALVYLATCLLVPTIAILFLALAYPEVQPTLSDVGIAGVFVAVGGGDWGLDIRYSGLGIRDEGLGTMAGFR